MSLHSESISEIQLAVPRAPSQHVTSSEALKDDSNRSAAGFSRVALVLVMILAFLLGATPAQNSDFWLHLASGKALAEGHWGVGAFSYTAAPDGPVNPTWLFDLLCYWLYLALGLDALVLMKCLLGVALSWSLVARARTDSGLLLACLGAALTLVAIGPWQMAVKPVCVSFFLFSLTLNFLDRQQPDRQQSTEPQRVRPESWKAYWPLFVIFPLWANLDEWFLVGPAAVGLYFLGSVVASRMGAPAPPRPRTLAIVFLVGLGTCLLRPNPLAIPQIPGLLTSELNAALSNDFYLREQFLAPFRSIYAVETFFQHPAGLAYWTLAIGGLLSLFFVPACWPRILVWAAFLGLALYLQLAAPFFAVVAGPLLALNVTKALQPVRSRLHAIAGIAGLAGTLALFALVIAAWPGWLQPRAHGPRAWSAAEDPSLKLAAERLASWRRQGALPPSGHGFHLTPETANFFAWHCGAEKSFMTARLEGAVDEYAALRVALMASGNDLDWRALFRKHRIDHVVLFAADQRMIHEPLFTMLANQKEWTLIHVGGKAVVLGWHDPQDSKRPNPFSSMRIDLDKLAFGPRTDSEVLRDWPGRDARMHFWWESFYRSPPKGTFALDEANLFLSLFDILRPAQNDKNFSLIQYSLVGGLLGNVDTVGGTGLELLAGIALYGPKVQALRVALDDGPVATLYLAVQAARRALAHDPDNARAYLALGEAYYRLSNQSRERVWAASYPLLGKVRTVQAVYGFTQAARLNPELLEPHLRLSEIYQSMDYLDLAARHYKAFVDLLPQARPRLQKSPEVFEKRLQFARAKYQEMATKVARLQDRLQVNSLNLKVVDRVNLAGRLGLAGKALETLLDSDIAAFGAEGMELELNLLLNTGQVAEVRDWMLPEHMDKIGDYSAFMIKTQMAAAIGDYEPADQFIESMTKVLGNDKKRVPLRHTLALSIGALVLGPKPDEKQLDYYWGQVSRLNGEAMHMVLRGLLSLESGNRDEANKQFASALSFWSSPAGNVFALRHPELRTAQQIARYFVGVLAMND